MSWAEILMGSRLFQFTPLREGRLPLVGIAAAVAATFQFTPLREGRHTSSCLLSMIPKFQFTPLREGRRLFS